MLSNSAGNRKTKRVVLVVPVAVSTNGDEGNPFSEKTTTLIVNATGALVYLTTAVFEGQKLQMVNSLTGDKILCTVASVTKSGQEKAKWEVGIAFAEQKPRFWGISFPPDDWDSANRKLPEPSIRRN
jgi:hypothetical protein